MGKYHWQRVTTEFVCTFATEGCPNCDGKGYTGTAEEPTGVCSCATLNFRREMISTGHVRQRKQRIGNVDKTWLEYTPVVDSRVTEYIEKMNKEGEAIIFDDYKRLEVHKQKA